MREDGDRLFISYYDTNAQAASMAARSRAAKPAPRDTELTLRDYQLLAELRHLLAQFLTFSEAAAREAGLAPRQHQALLAIKGHPHGRDVTIGDLAAWLGIRPHSAVGLVDRLVARGYLTRRADPHDGRRILLSLTAHGEHTLACLSAIHRDELRRLAPLLNPVLARLSLPAPQA